MQRYDQGITLLIYEAGGGGGGACPQIKLNHGLFSIPYKWFINIRNITMIFNKMRVSPFLLQTNTFPNSQAENMFCFFSH